MKRIKLLRSFPDDKELINFSPSAAQSIAIACWPLYESVDCSTGTEWWNGILKRPLTWSMHALGSFGADLASFSCSIGVGRSVEASTPNGLEGNKLSSMVHNNYDS